MAVTGTPPLATKRERTGWYFYDWANSAFSTTVITVFLGPFLTTITEQAAGCAIDADTCDGTVHPLGIPAPTTPTWCRCRCCSPCSCCR
jgi:UMF1 family MFS transporter